MRFEQFVIPISFTWYVARSGYRWIDGPEGRVLCAIEEPNHRYGLNPLDRYEDRHPLMERTGLFREFAELAPTEKEILGFANKFGQLEDGDNLPVDTDFGEAVVHAENLELWQGEIRKFKQAMSFWDAINIEKVEAWAEWKAALATGKLPLAVQRKLHITDDDPMMIALSAIQQITDANLSQHVVPRLIFRSDKPRLQVTLEPTNLLGALWLQFALAVDSLKRFAKCMHCGVLFEISRAPRTGKRPDAKYCNDRCRVAHYRGRIDEARRLHAAGQSINEIARRLEAQVSRVKRWVASIEPKQSTGRRRNA